MRVARAEPERLRAYIEREAHAAGFDVVAFTTPEAAPAAPARLAEFLSEGRHGTMDWMAETAMRRARPRTLWPEVRSIIMLGMNYGPEGDPLPILKRKDRAAISVYARNRDYHEVIKGRLKQIAGKLAGKAGADVKVFVDTAPVMEKPLAAAAGLGWQGKHTNLVSRQLGSWLFLGSIFTTAEIAPDLPEIDHCGSCRACLDICPTDAFPAPYQLDARRCISYLTIEHKGPIPREFREKMGNRIYGCDDCLAVCPWNKFAKAASESKLKAREDLKAPALADFLEFDDPSFRAFFSGSPIKRIGRDRFIRNVLIAAGNSAEEKLIPACERLLGDGSPLVRGAAIWALSRLMASGKFDALRRRMRPLEPHPQVQAEWDYAAVEVPA
ncbi:MULTISPECIES: tRNA epoxyqueuosine(34) reductase QueG [Chelativorans]|jgi:epoxyqueuosine reductase|uniref:Epoxyqueuosine reductase n=1 Tax=Chelativorans sp. (strain BNC1) TaxID=266779 RepID=Q11CA8_CHESB|nr:MULTISPECIES: tRNA epoxyqueuosine(34) reductase QueG [Chelativorans]